MRIATFLLGAFLFATSAVAQGLPPEPFSPVTPAGYTHYVDNTALTSTDASNPYGTPARPRRNVPSVLPAGSVVEVRGGPYNIGGAKGTITSQGTATAPVIVKGIGNPLVQGSYGALLTLAGSYGVWEGFQFDWVAVTLPGTYWSFRNNEVRNHSPAGNSSAVSVGGSLVTVKGNWIHHNGNSENAKEVDVHGILVSPGARGVWILGNHGHNNGGDSIQVGQATSAEPWAQGVFIGQNTFHEDRENAIDIKKSRDVIVYKNVLYGYKERLSSSGEAIVTHDGAERVWVINNVVALSVRGIVSTNAQTYIVAGNLIVGIRHNPANSYDPTSRYGSHAIITRDSRNTYHLNNTIWESDGGISLASGNADAKVVSNNLVNSDGNGIVGTTTIAEANWIVSVHGDPLVVDADAADYRLTDRSPLINAGVPSDVWAAYAFLYGVSIGADIYGNPRPTGVFDIGSAEYLSPLAAK